MTKEVDNYDLPPDELTALVEGSIRDETGLSQGIKTITEIKPSKEGDKNTDIEIKTILDHNQVIDHTMAEFIANLATISNEELNTKPIIKGLTEKLERKFLSLHGISRTQVVDMVRNNDGTSSQKPGFMSKLFGSRR